MSDRMESLRDDLYEEMSNEARIDEFTERSTYMLLPKILNSGIDIIAIQANMVQLMVFMLFGGDVVRGKVDF